MNILTLKGKQKIQILNVTMATKKIILLQTLSKELKTKDL